MEKSSRLKKLPFISAITVQGILVAALIVSAFFMGSLWTKVKMLEKGGAAGIARKPGVPATGSPVATFTPTPSPVPPKLEKDDYVLGSDNARIILFEYSDLECPFCKRFHPTAQQILKEYQGKVKWVYRHYPLSFHANAQKESEAAECAGELGGNTAFWKYIDAIYERTTSNGTGFALEKLTPLAVELGLNQKQFQTCLDSGKHAQRIQNQMAQGIKEGVTGTPGNILLDSKTGKTTSIPGAVPFEQIKPVIDEMLQS